MVQASGKSSINFGFMTCSLSILAVTATTLAIFLGVVITPWLGLPLRSTIQSYISEAGFKYHRTTADLISHDNSQLVNVTDNNTATAYISGKNHNRDEIVHPKPTDEGISNQSAAKPKRKAYNGDMAKKESVNQFPQGDSSISTNSSLQPSEKQLQSISSQAPSGSHADLQNKSAITAAISSNDNKAELIVLPLPISSDNGTAKVRTSSSSTGESLATKVPKLLNLMDGSFSFPSDLAHFLNCFEVINF